VHFFRKTNDAHDAQTIPKLDLAKRGMLHTSGSIKFCLQTFGNILGAI
jgi:hypothetical protein